MNTSDLVKEAMKKAEENVEPMSNLILQMDYSRIAPEVETAKDIDEESMSDVLAFTRSVYCKIKLPKVAKQKWTLLQVQIGQSCKGCI